RWTRPRGSCPDRPDEPGRHRSRTDCQLRRRDARGTCPPTRLRNGVNLTFQSSLRNHMDDNAFVLVLNAGSSSLKFSVYQPGRPDSWRLEARGQIEGIGTSPRFSAKDGAGVALTDERLDGVRDAYSA